MPKLEVVVPATIIAAIAKRDRKIHTVPHPAILPA
jgi:hypothetical protein